MKITVRTGITTLLGFLLTPLCATAQDAPLRLPIAKGPYEGTLESLSKYECPEWFRDAKFGIWAHWGPQAVPMAGDWYARRLYEEGGSKYKHHLANYGHPSQFGYKDIIPLWKAEKWDPDRLMALYKAAGARYFVSMGVHHDNFFLWNSKLHRWNSVNMGPKRDVVADWQKAAKKHGLRFGVSEHLGASFTWFQKSHGADKNGPKAGVPYDGANPQYQDLYHFPARPGDTGWYSNDPRWHQQWYGRIKELVDNYELDLLYTDGAVPFGNEVGRSMVAHLYNKDLRKRGRQQVVYACKQVSDGRWIQDVERGVMPKINPHPWQTDTSIGDWYYNKDWKFRPVNWTIHMLVDIVSKNGNLLLNVVQRPDGSLDPEVELQLATLAQWTKVHGEAIYETRPWQIYGEGAVKATGGHFKEDFKYSARDIRFTTKGAALYALALGWPEDGVLKIRSLAQPARQKINVLKSIRLLGYDGKIEWRQTPEALFVTLPAKPVSEYTAALKINGADLQAVPFEEVALPIQADAKGNFKLGADEAALQGSLKTEDHGGQPNIGYWDNAADFATWKVKFTTPGTFKVTANIAALAGAPFVFEATGQTLSATAKPTGAWDKFETVDIGQLEIKTPGDVEVKLRPQDAKTWKAINLRDVRLTKLQ